MNMLKRFVSGLGQQTAPFGFAPDDPEASYKAGLGYIGDVGASLLANNQGGVNPFANLGASLQQAKQSSVTRNKEAYTAQRLMEEAAAKKAERERQDALSGEWQKWVGANSDKFGEYAGIAPYLDPSEGMKLLSGMKPDWRPATAEEKAQLGLGSDTPLVITADGPKVLGGGNTNITVEGNKYGTIPQGFQLIEDEMGVRMEPVPGSPAALEAEQAENANATKAGKRQTTTDVVVNAAAKARALADNWAATGTVGKVASVIGESDAAEVRRQVETLRSVATIETLTAMRQASPTGAALGSVTQQENAMLAAAAGALDPSAGPKRFKEQLDNYERTLLEIVHGPQEGLRLFKETRAGKSDLPSPDGGGGRTSSGVPWQVEAP